MNHWIDSEQNSNISLGICCSLPHYDQNSQSLQQAEITGHRKSFWDTLDFWGAVNTSIESPKVVPPNFLFSISNSQKSRNARSWLYSGWGSVVILRRSKSPVLNGQWHYQNGRKCPWEVSLHDFATVLCSNRPRFSQQRNQDQLFLLVVTELRSRF
jgi:hypothetical protein